MNKSHCLTNLHEIATRIIIFHTIIILQICTPYFIYLYQNRLLRNGFYKRNMLICFIFIYIMCNNMIKQLYKLYSSQLNCFHYI
jgi:hypothetical protein